MENSYLFASDFDLTLFDTKALSPRGIGLEEGYEYAVGKIFGLRGLDLYRDEGGLRNRAPSEVVTSLAEKDGSILEYARERYGKFISSGVENPLSFLGAWSAGSKVSILSEMLVHFKLQLFLDEISKSWPLPYPGVADFFRIIRKTKMREKISLHIGILSSGHFKFIRKTLALWDMPEPAVILTDDDLRQLRYPKLAKDRVKPAPFPFRFLHYRWLKRLNGNKPIRLSHIRASLPRMMYFGDDSEKDGGLARNVGVPFGWYQGNEKGKPGFSPNQQFPGGSFSFSDWTKLCDFIGQSSVKKLFFSGTPLAEIFSLF